MTYRYHAPLDPDCPKVREFNQSFYDDPITAECGCADEIAEAWERRHRSECQRCREFGCENIEVTD